MYIKAVGQATSAQEKLERLRVDLDDTTVTSLRRLGEIGEVFDDRLTKLKDGADEACNILVTSSNHLKDRVDDIEMAAASA